MYKQFYGFKERPFKLVPNPHYLFLSKSHEEALGHLRYAVSQGDGFVEITGEVGTGKTTLLRVFLEKLGPDIEAAYIFNPKLNSIQLLKTINDEFGIDSTPDNTKDLIDILNTYLIEKKAENKKVILLIDEAQNLSIEVLEQLRLLSNLETTQSKLMQIILVGQPELADMLDSHELRQLEQRITLSCHIMPLSFKETRAYINHRISIASHRPGVKFTYGAYSLVYQYSNGIPRLINIVCDRALLAGFTRDMKKITRNTVKLAIKELAGRRGYKIPPIWMNKNFVPLYIGLGLISLGIIFLSPAIFNRETSPDITASVLESPATENTKHPESTAAVAPSKQPRVSPPSPQPSDKKAKADTRPPVRNPVVREEKTAARERKNTNIEAASESPPVTVKQDVIVPEPEKQEVITEQERKILAMEEKAKIAMAIEKELSSSTKNVGKNNKEQNQGIEDLLQDMDTKMSRFLAVSTLVEYWDMESGPSNYFGSIEDDLEFFKLGAEKAGLKVNRIIADLKLIGTLNIPTIITLYPHNDPTPRYLTITRLRKSEVVLSLSDREIPVSPEALLAFWDGETFVMWKDFLNFSGAIPINASVNSILSLKMHLKEIGHNNIVINGIYDDAASGVIRQIQKESGLTVDGVVGPLTKIVLYNQKDDLSIPHITR